MDLNVLRSSTNLAKISFATKKTYELAITKKIYKFIRIFKASNIYN